MASNPSLLRIDMEVHLMQRTCLDRRAAVLAGLAAGVSAVATGRAIAGAAMPTERRRPPRLDGRLRFDEPARAAAADDFGHLVQRAPKAVLLPASDRDIAATIRWAAARGLKVSPRGQGHSVFGRSQAPHGIVIDMTQLRAVHTVAGDRIVVDAGATWRDVLAATLPHGLTPPVLTEYLQLSVGGTLAVGGVGGTTSRFGVQSDNVLELEVVTGRGRRLRCSPEHRAELFDAVRAGLGQVAVVTRATLKLVRAPQSVRRFALTYPNLTTMLHDTRLLAADDRFDAVQGAARPSPSGGWAFALELPSSRSMPNRRTTRHCSPACPTDDRWRRQPRCPTSTISNGSTRSNARCAPTANGSSRIRG
jgi:FAD/FMN-containing dehydrogenase